ncbi:MAG: hypothetical protein ACHQ50_15260 [Fimbriimonadales bacterium]
MVRLEAYRSFVGRGISEYAVAKSSTDLSPDLVSPSLVSKELGIERLWPAAIGVAADKGGPYVVPRQYGAFVEIDGRTDVLETMARFEDAKRAWSTTGPKILAQLGPEQANFRTLLNNASAAKGGRLFFFEPNLYLETVFATIWLLPLFLIIDWLAALTARPKRHWPRRVLA